MALRTIKTTRGHSPCSLALRFGLDDCDRLQVHNPSLRRSDLTLPEGQEVNVPQPENKVEAAITETLNSYKLTTRQPRIAFIQDKNRGDQDDNDCGLDPVIGELAISNYVVDRGGDGCTPNNFPDETVFRFDPLGSEDPDHFKVQVVDNGVPEGVNEVQVSLFALRPSYSKNRIGVVPVLERERKGYTRPVDPKRSLLNVICKRVGTSSYFRSPYLRLVTFESDRARRPNQTLLVTDYFDDRSLSDTLRIHTEILHHQIEAHYKIPSCPHGLCGVSAFAHLPYSQVIDLVFHIVGERAKSVNLLNHIRRAVYTWTRRIYASAAMRVEIRRMDMLSLPQNVIFVGDSQPDFRGARSTGIDQRSRKSHMQFTVDGTLVRVELGANETPSATGDRIVRTIQDQLPGYTAKKFLVNLVNGTAMHATDPCDILVFKPMNAGETQSRPAIVSGARSTDSLVLGSTGVTSGQQIESIDNADWWRDGRGHFLFADGHLSASKQERALRWNFFDDRGLNIYVVPFGSLANQDKLDDQPVGLARLAGVGSIKSTVGPAVFLGHDGITGDHTTIAHECAHILMHCSHADQPPKDALAAAAGQISSELMQSAADPSDAHDTARHISDFPIAAQYQVLNRNGTAVNRRMDGSTVMVDASGNSIPVRETPVTRMRHFATELGLAENRKWVRLDPEFSQESAEAEAA